MTGNKNYKKYFETHAKSWVWDAYNDDGYNFPMAYHRARIVAQFVASLGSRRLKILDLGCGGGDVTFLLARLGHEVVGVDRSQNMIDIAESRRRKEPKNIQNHTSFKIGSVENVGINEKFDVVVAMGLIGYLPNDKILFSVANKMLKPKGHFLVSCRNQLFNMSSLTFRTKNEIKRGNAIKLIEEIEELYSRVPAKDTDTFIKRFKQAAAKLPAHMTYSKNLLLSPSQKHTPKTPTGNLEPRQQTPQQLKGVAAQTGFAHEAYLGVGPHLLDPNINKLLPPQLFNKISASLEAFEHLPISLAWSSVFIGAFKKRK